MRIFQHIIDTKAIKRTMQTIPDYWVVRDLTERDYGIDLMVEIFEQTGLDDNGHPQYDSTGHVCYLQIKGTDTVIHQNQDNKTVSFPIDKKALLYVEKFSTPFILLRVSTNETSSSIYFLWLQRYILEILDLENPYWRIEKQESYSVKIPITNTLPTNSKKIEKISSRIKYIEEHSEFYERYSLMSPAFESIIGGHFTPEQFDSYIKELKRIRTFKTLLSNNNCQVEKQDIDNLIEYLNSVRKGKKKPKKIEDFLDPLPFNLDLLLTDNFMRISSEIMIVENDNDTVY